MQLHGPAMSGLTFAGPITPAFEEKKIEKQW